VKAAVRDRYGSVGVVYLDDIPKPTPVDDQLLVRVEAASVNRADLDALGPKPTFARLFMGVRSPRVRQLGVDVAGVVESTGPAATRFRPGDRVFGDMFSFGSGSLAEFVCAPERAFQQIPPDLSFEVAATLPHSAVLAVQALRLRNGRTPKPGGRVLVDGAGGNVGPFAVQLAKQMGAEVTGVDSGAKLDLVRSIGADHVIDYTRTDYTRSGERYDWIVDVDSHHPVFAVRRALRDGGVYVTLGGTGTSILAALLVGPLIGRLTGRHISLMFWWKPFHPPDVATLTGLIADGKLTPAIDRRYPLSQAVNALRYVDDGHARGKVIVTPD
jgi:NADPH:quinone reductase-like Zn-dependent oxidoreductase